MTTIWRNGHFLAPSVERFLDQLICDLQEGRSLIVVLPNGTKPVELKRALAQRLAKIEKQSDTLRLREVTSISKAIQELAEHLQVEWEPAKIPRTIENLLHLRMAQYPDEEIVFFFEGLDALSDEARQIWLELLTRWSTATHAIANSTPPIAVLCLVVQADCLLARLPESMLYLQIRWWWGVPSRIEVQLYCHTLFSPGDETEAMLWREYLLPHLVGDDAVLLTYLWDKLFCEPADLLLALETYAKTRWPEQQATVLGEVCQSWHQSRYGESSLPEPPAQYRTLWANGIITCSTEHGVELHPAMAAYLGHHEAIKHRLWRGQAALLLPLLDQSRLTLCAYFTRKYGPQWPLRWGFPRPEEEEALAENPLTCEWRYLRELLEFSAAPKDERQYAALAREGLALRNRLAHYQPVTYKAFQAFWRKQRLLAEL
jgi:hypothetical protein